MDQKAALQRAAEAVAATDALLVGAGAGMGVPSGVPDFRGNRGSVGPTRCTSGSV
jgi:NAD-dependent SIR2 family protein deacetylase